VRNILFVERINCTALTINFLNVLMGFNLFDKYQSSETDYICMENNNYFSHLLIFSPFAEM